MSLGKEKKGGIKKLASSVGKPHFETLRMLFTSLCFVPFIKPRTATTFCSYTGSKLRLPKGGRDDKSEGRLSRHSSGRFSDKYSNGEPDPGVISEDEDEFRVMPLSLSFVRFLSR